MNAYATHVVSYLLAQSWQIALLAAIVSLISLALRNRTAHIRYLLWLIVLTKCLVPPLLTVPLAVLPEPSSSPSVALLDLPQDHSAPETPVFVGEDPKPHESTSAVPSARELMALAWMAGVFLFMLWVGSRAVRYTAWLRARREALPPALRESVRDSELGFQFRKWPRIWLLEDINQPFVWGLLRGSVYLPADFVGLSGSDRQRSILAHELSHVARFDAGINLLQVIAQAAYWFHPLVWWTNRRIRQEREKCCDEMAVAHLHTPPEHYTGAIVDVLAAERRSAHPIPSLAIVGSVKDIEERIKTMLKPGKTFRRRPSLVAATVASLIAVVTIPTALVLTARGQALPTAQGADTSAAPGEKPEQPRCAARTFNSKAAFAVFVEETPRSATRSIGHTPSAVPLEIPACWFWWVRPLSPVKDWDLLVQEIRRNKVLGLELESATDSDVQHLADLTGLQRLNLTGTQITDVGLAYLKGLTGLRDLQLCATDITDAGMEHLKGMNELQILDVSRTKITDAGLAHLKDLPRLQSLWLWDTQITDVGLAQLRGLTGIQHLNLTGTQVTNAGLSHLKPLTGLQELWLEHTQITDAGLTHLKDLTGMRLLLLADIQITDAGLECLKAMTGLQDLRVPAQITDVGLEHLKGLAGLRSLGLSGSKITDAGLAYVEGLTKLEELDLSDTPITDMGLAHLRGLNGLEQLELSNTQITDMGLGYVEGLTKLERLSLPGTKITGAGLVHLKRLTGLQQLLLSDDQITNVGLEHLKGLTRLMRLELSNTQITDAGLAYLEGLTGLRFFYASNTQITDAGLAHLEVLAGLWRLGLSGTQITDKGLEHLKGMTGLRYLFLDGTQITDAGLANLQGLTGLQWLDLPVTQVTDAGVQRLKQSLPNLTITRGETKFAHAHP